MAQYCHLLALAVHLQVAPAGWHWTCSGPLVGQQVNRLTPDDAEMASTCSKLFVWILSLVWRCGKPYKGCYASANSWPARLPTTCLPHRQCPITKYPLEPTALLPATYCNMQTPQVRLLADITQSGPTVGIESIDPTSGVAACTSIHP
jgi:hypothetical protein